MNSCIGRATRKSVSRYTPPWFAINAVRIRSEALELGASHETEGKEDG